MIVSNNILETTIGPIKLKRPAILASGILGISLDVFERLYNAGAGAVVTKSLSQVPWEGYSNPTVVKLGNCGNGWINAVGLSNPGAHNFASLIKESHNVPIMVSLVGSAPFEFEEMISEFSNCTITAYELNMSCPHVDTVGLEVGDDPELVADIVRSTKKASPRTPVIVKVGLGSSNYLDTVRAAVDAGVDAITAINTVRSIAINAELQMPILSHTFGGLSGPPIKPIALRCVFEIAEQCDIPIMGCGGVSTWEDAIEFILAGASAVQIGSALGNTNNKNFGLFNEINNGIISYMKRKNITSIGDMVGLVKSNL